MLSRIEVCSSRGFIQKVPTPPVNYPQIPVKNYQRTPCFSAIFLCDSRSLLSFSTIRVLNSVSSGNNWSLSASTSSQWRVYGWKGLILTYRTNTSLFWYHKTDGWAQDLVLGSRMRFQLSSNRMWEARWSYIMQHKWMWGCYIGAWHIHRVIVGLVAVSAVRKYGWNSLWSLR